MDSRGGLVYTQAAISIAGAAMPPSSALPLGIDHKSYIKTLSGTDKHLAWKRFTDAFWNSDALGAGARAEFLFRRGFLRDKWVLYDLEQADAEAFVSDFQAAEIGQANGIYANVLDDRMLLIHTLTGYCAVPRIHALRGLDADEVGLSPEWAAHRARAPDLPAPDLSVTDLPTPDLSVPDLSVQVLPLLAGIRGRSGHVEVKRGHFSGFGKEGDLKRLSAMVKDWSLATRVPYLFADLLPQGPFMAGLFPRAMNRLSVILTRDLDSWDPVLVAATLRIGSDRSGEDLDLAAGGMSAPVDPETGHVGPLVGLGPGGQILRADSHPDSGARVAGLEVPGWGDIRATLLRIMDESSYLRVAMLDFTLLEDGRLGLIGPASPDMAPHQVHGPLLHNAVFAEVLRKLAL